MTNSIIRKKFKLNEKAFNNNYIVKLNAFNKLENTKEILTNKNWNTELNTCEILNWLEFYKNLVIFCLSDFGKNQIPIFTRHMNITKYYIIILL